MGVATWLSLSVAALLASPAEQEKKSVAGLVEEVAFGEPAVRDAALAALASRQDARAGAFEVLKETDESVVMAAAVLVLGRSGKRAQKELKELLSPEGYRGTTSKVLAGLAVLGPEGSWLAPEVLALVEVGVDGLERRAKSGGTNGLADMQTSQALFALAAIQASPKPALKQLERLLALELGRDELSRACRMTAAFALWKLGGAPERVLGILGEGLEQVEGLVVERAVFCLGEMGASAAPLRARLQERVAGASPPLQVELREALDKIDGDAPCEIGAGMR